MTLFKNISVILRQWKGGDGRFCAMKFRLRSMIFPASAGFKAGPLALPASA